MLAVYPQDKKAFIVIEGSREQILLSGILRDELDFSKWEMKSRTLQVEGQRAGPVGRGLVWLQC